VGHNLLRVHKSCSQFGIFFHSMLSRGTAVSSIYFVISFQESQRSASIAKCSRSGETNQTRSPQAHVYSHGNSTSFHRIIPQPEHFECAHSFIELQQRHSMRTWWRQVPSSPTSACHTSEWLHAEVSGRRYLLAADPSRFLPLMTS